MKKTTLLFTVVIAFSVMAHLSLVSAQELQGQNGVVCQFCQAENPVGSKFCGECGKSLQIIPIAKLESRFSGTDDRHNHARQSAQDSLEAKVLFELAGHLLAQGQYDLAATYYRRIVETYPASVFAKASLLMENESKRIAIQNRAMNADKKPHKKGNGSAFGGAFLGALIAPLAVLAVVSAAY
ncbi:MAG: hypothetical protein ACE5I1_00255 [bacterium]